VFYLLKEDDETKESDEKLNLPGTATFYSYI